MTHIDIDQKFQNQIITKNDLKNKRSEFIQKTQEHEKNEGKSEDKKIEDNTSPIEIGNIF